LVHYCLSFLFFVFASFTAFAAEPLELAHLSSLSDADQYAKELIESYKDSKDKQVVILHVGNELPRELKWVIAHLEKADFKTEVQLVTKDQLESQLTNETEDSVKRLELVDYENPETREFVAQTRLNVREAASRTALALKYIFGMPNGFTLWIRMKSSPEDKARDMKSAHFQALQAGLSVALSLYVKHLNGAELNIVRPALGIAAWVWINLYKARAISEWMGQGRMVTESRPGVWKVVKHPLFLRLAVFGRSLLSNAIFMWGAFGYETAFSKAGIASMAMNSFFTLFSRYWFEEWLANRQARTLKDGTVVVEEGQHTPKTTMRLRNIFEFANGMLKNLNLAHVPYIEWVFPAMGMAGIIKTAYDKRRWPLRQGERLANWLMGREQARQCTAILVGKS
jgi:hypothetical protein